MNTYAGAVANAKDALAEFFDMIAKAGVLDWLTGKIRELLAEFDRMKQSGELQKKAKEIADSSDCELRVMSVLKPMSDYSSVSDEIEYLYLIAKESGADMTVMFSDDAPKVTAEFVGDNNVERIVTGMHDGKDNSFLVKFNELSPTTPITMVSKDNMVYSMDLCRSYS